MLEETLPEIVPQEDLFCRNAYENILMNKVSGTSYSYLFLEPHTTTAAFSTMIYNIESDFDVATSTTSNYIGM